MYIHISLHISVFIFINIYVIKWGFILIINCTIILSTAQYGNTMVVKNSSVKVTFQ